MADNAAGAVADAGTAAGADAGKSADAGAEGKSILDGAQAPGKTGESTGEAADAAKKAADGTSKSGDDKTEAGKTQDKGATGAPEKYEPFKAPEGIALDEEAVKGFTDLAKKMNLSQTAAQELVDFQTTRIKAAQDANLKSFEDMQKGWASETRKALGADADKQLGFAAVARDKFFTGDAMKVLNESGLANHPALVKSLISIGKAISEDTFVEGKGEKGGGGKNAGKSAAQI